MILELKQMQCALGSELWLEYNKVSLPHMEVQPRLNSQNGSSQDATFREYSG